MQFDVNKFMNANPVR